MTHRFTSSRLVFLRTLLSPCELNAHNNGHERVAFHELPNCPQGAERGRQQAACLTQDSVLND